MESVVVEKSLVMMLTKNTWDHRRFSFETFEHNSFRYHYYELIWEWVDFLQTSTLPFLVEEAD